MKREEQYELHEFDTVDKDLLERGTKEYKRVYVPICKPENFREDMAVDDKNIGGEGYTIFSNRETGKIALMVMSTKGRIINEALSHIPVAIRYAVKTFTKDLSQTYSWVIKTMFLGATSIADKFHVIKLALEALQDVRVRFRQEALSERRIQTEIYKEQEAEKRDIAKKEGKAYRAKDPPPAHTYKNGETKMQLLARSRYLLFKYKTEWTETQIERAEILFKEFPEIKKTYDITIAFRNFYRVSPGNKDSKKNAKKKYNIWYQKASASEIPEIINFISTVKHHSEEIFEFFEEGKTNANAESLNSNIQRFVRTNFGIRERNFFHFRLKKIFA